MPQALQWIGVHQRVVWLACLCLGGCAPLIGPYSPTAYQNATSLKAETLALMEKGTEPYAEYERQIEALMVDIDKAYEFVNGIPSNSLSAKQWLLLKNQDGDLLGKFFLRWKERKTLSESFIHEFQGIVSDAFDEIICLEANKKQATTCGNTGGK